MRFNKVKKDYFLNITFGFALLGFLSQILLLFLVFKVKLVFDFKALKVFSLLSLIFILSYLIWYVLLSYKLREALSLKKSILHGVLGAFFISFAVSCCVGILGVLSDLNFNFLNFKSNLVYFFLFLIGGLIYCAPFNILYGFFLGKILKSKKERLKS